MCYFSPRQTTAERKFNAMPTTKRSAAPKRKPESNGELTPAQIAALQKQMLSRRSNQERYAFLQQLPWAERREVIKSHFRTLRSARAVARWLALFTSADLHTLLCDIIPDNHPYALNGQNGRRRT